MNPPPKAMPFARKMLLQIATDGIHPTVYADELLPRELLRRTADLSPAHANGILTGSRNRQLSAFIQLVASDNGIDAGIVDGFWGPQTAYAFDALLFMDEHGSLPPYWRDEVPLDINPNNWPTQDEASLISRFGQPGDESNLVAVNVPYTHRLAWDLNSTVKRIRCHKLVADSLLRVLQNVKAQYGEDQIKGLRLDRYGGCFNPRKMRGGSSWSTHAWGIALDYHPDQNQLKWGRDKAVFAGPEYDSWWRCWEEEGWLSLGRTVNYDWMHVQAAKR